jgi:hypothetical protein
MRKERMPIAFMTILDLPDMASVLWLRSTDSEITDTSENENRLKEDKE